jgi:PAS domain S-box-containing protein
VTQAGGTGRLRVDLDASGLLEHVEAAVLATTLEGVILYANPYCEVLYGRAPETLAGAQSADYAAEAVPLELQAEIGEAILAGETWEGEFRVLRADGETVAVHAIDSPLFDDDGKVVGVVSLAFDVTEARDREDRIRTQMGVTQFLADAGELLGSSLDYPETFRRLVRVCVPFLADLCIIDVAEGNSVRRMASVHADPEMHALVEELERRFPPDPYGDHPAVRVIRSGKAEVRPEVDDEILRAMTRDDEHHDLVKKLDLSSFMCVPLIARGTTLGALTLLSSRPGRRFGDEDLALAQDLARRAALALDNARLYSDRSHVARALQSSLLPPSLPVIEGLDIAARYEAAGAGYEVGGDFYDVFEAEPGRWVFAIGDVSGKGPEAGAIAGLARYTLRAASLRERVPSRLLEILHEALVREESAEDRFCTVCLALVESVARSGRRRRRGQVTLAVACGGHPPPVIVRHDGTAETADCKGTLLGLTEQVSLADTTITLDPGDALVLYTDGVTEAQSWSQQLFGDERLLSLLASRSADSAEAIADAVMASVTDYSDGAPRDDIALLVMRVPPAV